LNGRTSILNVIKIHQLLETLLAGGHTDGQHGDLVSFPFLFREGRLRSEIGRACSMNEEF